MGVICAFLMAMIAESANWYVCWK